MESGALKESEEPKDSEETNESEETMESGELKESNETGETTEPGITKKSEESKESGETTGSGVTKKPEESKKSEDPKESGAEYIVSSEGAVLLLCLSQRPHTWLSSAPHWRNISSGGSSRSQKGKQRVWRSLARVRSQIPAGWLREEHWQQLERANFVSLWKLPLFTYKLVILFALVLVLVFFLFSIKFL